MKKIIHIIISIVYIIWGIGAPLTLIKSLASLDLSSLTSLGTLVSVATGLVMLLAGIFGLFRIKPLKRRIFGVIIFILAASSVITSLVGGTIAWQSILQAVMAWLYIIW
ncbi:MAG: hypothetical protein IKM33_03460 [Clostridia bacterium]|nr:hypothetical protein [Clostridia bacterium]